MYRRLRKTAGRIYWQGRSIIHRSAAARWLGRFSNPLWVARRCLHRAVRRQRYRATGWLLDIGCGSRPYQHLFEHVSRYVGIDIPSPYCKVDAFADGMHLPFQDATFDTVLCNQVLEHVCEPHRLISEIERVLKPGGTLMLTTPQVWGLHHEPHDFFRYTKYGLTHLAQAHGLIVVTVAPTCGMWATLAQRLADTVAHLYCARLPRCISPLVGLCLAPLLTAGYALDRLFGRHGDTLDNLLVARKAINVATPTATPATSATLPYRPPMSRAA